MMALQKEERVLASYWKTPLPHQLEVISLTAFADSGESGFISLQYQFIGGDSCIEKRNKRKSGKGL
jgi:hypothetical protein